MVRDVRVVSPRGDRVPSVIGGRGGGWGVPFVVGSRRGADDACIKAVMV